MDVPLLLAQATPIPSHALAALAALLLGAVQLALPKGTGSHRVMGYMWAALMLYVAVSSLFIHDLRTWGQWSYIHILSVTTLVMLPAAVFAAHRHKVGPHRRGMISLYVFALVVAGLFTLLPGRVMHDVVFASSGL